MENVALTPRQSSPQRRDRSTVALEYTSPRASQQHGIALSALLSSTGPLAPPPPRPAPPPPCYERKNLKPVLFLLPFAHSHFSLFCHFAFSRVNRKQRRWWTAIARHMAEALGTSPDWLVTEYISNLSVTISSPVRWPSICPSVLGGY
jgi:hypothetical protein